MLSLGIRSPLGASSLRSVFSMSHLRRTLIITTRDTSKRRGERESYHTCVKTPKGSFTL